jgi:hypothetical protein
MGIDLRELEAVVTVLSATAVEIQREGRAVVSKGALNIKRDWRANARASSGAHARLYPGSISYDVTEGPGEIEAVIGPDKAKAQGALGNLLEFGSVKNPPHNDGGRALDAEEDRFVAAVEAMAGRVLG